jgi:hypothetical protein
VSDLTPEDTDIDAFTNAAFVSLAAGDEGRLVSLSDAVMAPVFLEHFITEIRPGNQWNDVIYCVVAKLIEANRELGYLRPSLDEKRDLVARPDASFADLVDVEQMGDQTQIRPRAL